MTAAPGEGSALVVDASVVIKWHVEELHSAIAQFLLAADATSLHAPDLLFPEVGNILWKKVRRGEVAEERGREIMRLVTSAPITVHHSADLAEAALMLAVRTGRTVYDSLYLALAVHLDARVATADEKLYNALRVGSLGGRVAWIEEFADGP